MVNSVPADSVVVICFVLVEINMVMELGSLVEKVLGNTTLGKDQCL